MTIREALKEVCRISEDEAINEQNWMDSIQYSDNIYDVDKLLTEYIPQKSITFLPSFKGIHVVEQLGILSTDEENEMRVFLVKSPAFENDPDAIRRIEYNAKYMGIKTKYDKTTGVMTLIIVESWASK
jgi:hypothetical protein